MKKIIEYKLGESLQGKLLLSLPVTVDNRFIKSVILVTSHNEKGAMGIIINKPSVHQFSQIVKSIDNKIDEKAIINNKAINIVLGGPVNANNLFIVHGNDYHVKESIQVTPNIYMTNQPSCILAMAEGKGPSKALISIGCCNWKLHQLEEEIEKGAWILSNQDMNSLFNVISNRIYSEVYENIGFDIYNPSFFISQ